MKALPAAILVLLLIVTALAVSRPDRASFDRFIGRAAEAPDGNLLQRAGAAIATLQAHLTTQYHDHALWATAEVTVGSRHERYLGVAGTWIRLGTHGR